jgi:hypothetical protein
MTVRRLADALIGALLWVVEFAALTTALVCGFSGEPWQALAGVAVAMATAVVVGRWDRRGR